MLKFYNGKCEDFIFENVEILLLQIGHYYVRKYLNFNEKVV
jgi:hypothetical protein